MDYWLIGADGYPNIEVVGEAWREREITTAVGQSPGIDQEIEVTLPAVIVPEPDNPHDRNAISVRVGGQVVGYIAKEETRSYLNDVQRVTASGHRPMTFARIWMVRRRHSDGGSRFYSRISIALPYRGLELPKNASPTGAHSLLPWGAGLQVTGEDQHFEVLRPYISSAESDLVIVTLHRTEKQLKSGQGRELIEVRLDGERIGELTPTTSRHFLPTVDHTAARGGAVATYARIKGSQLTAEVVIQGAKATELQDEWLNGPFIVLPALIPPGVAYDVPPAYIAQAQKPRTASSAKAAPVAAAAKSGCVVVLVAVASLVGIGALVVEKLV